MKNSKRNHAPTLQDVADAACSTAMAASVVLNGARSTARVSEATRARILEAAAQLGYRRNALAHGLNQRRSDTLGVVSPLSGGEPNLYFLSLLQGILAQAAERRQNTTVFSITDWHTETDRILHCCDGRVDGMIFIAPRHLPEPFMSALRRHTPVVLVHGDSMPTHIWNLGIDDEGGGYIMTRFLISQGHRRIAHFPGDGDMEGARLRAAGYRRALEEAGIGYDPSLVLPGQFNTDSGRQRMIELIRRRPYMPLPTAIFCANDNIAYGCMEILANYGIHIPQTISIVGFDDTLMARMTVPPLTTMRQPLREMGQQAVERLLAEIEDEGREGEGGKEQGSEETNSVSRQELYPVELVVRGSVGPPSSS